MEALQGVHKTIQGYKKETKTVGGMKAIKIAMTLHHHLHSPLVHASYRHLFQHGSLRQTGLVSTVTAITLHTIESATTTTIILHPIGCVIGGGGGGGGGWSQSVSSGRWHGFNVGAVILTHLLCLIRVTKDNHVVIIGQPEKPVVDVTEEFPANLLIS
jgi:hypothetical protein